MSTQLLKKRAKRVRRKARVRNRIAESRVMRARLTVYRSLKHMRAQVVSDLDGKVIASASTLEKEVLSQAASMKVEGAPNDSRSSKSISAAKAVGLAVAKRCLEHQVTEVVFDRNGFLFHGRVKAVADGAREGGLQF